jgi:phosphoribosylformimino-5-aminoimidazole carboxamide ribotide isomerase
VPAIDLRGGYAVRLERGDPDKETRYDADPTARSRAFVSAGARTLHVVDLDGALGTGENLDALRAICAAIDVPVQTGGGIRTAADAQARFDAGAASVVLGTMLAEAPDDARALVERFGARIVAGIDARGDVVATRGWLNATGISRDALVQSVATWGVERIVYTEIARDGMGAGYDVDALAHVASLADVRITASGGARTLDDLRALRDGTPSNVDAAIVGRALYAGTLDLAEALAALA